MLNLNSLGKLKIHLELCSDQCSSVNIIPQSGE